MKAILIHRHPDCARCARLARMHHRFDWRDRVGDTVAPPRSGPLRLGQIVVEDVRTGALHEGAAAFDVLCLQIPLYAPLRALLRVRPFRAYVEREINGCAGDACEVPAPERAL